MARTSNIRPVLDKTYEGGPVNTKLNEEQELERSVLTCMLWEKEFYADGNATADRIRGLVQHCSVPFVADLAVKARGPYKLRHAPLWLLVGLMDRNIGNFTIDGETFSDLICQVVQRPDEMAELISLYWRSGKKPLPNQLKRGLAKAFGKFSEYQLAKHDRPGLITVRDVMFLCHPKPANSDREALYKRIANKSMVTPDTWETQLSGGADAKDTFIRLIGERKLGADALLKNLRKMQEVSVHADVIRTALLNANVERVLPFRFLTAAKYAPTFEPELEKLMFKCLEGYPKLKGTTNLLIDKSGSMSDPVSAKSELRRYDAAKALAVLAREVCQNVNVLTFDTQMHMLPPRRGFALVDALGTPIGGTHLGAALKLLARDVPADRTIVFTDEQSQDQVGGPQGKGYMVNVATYDKTVGYGNWTRVSGFSEAVIDFILQVEAK